MPNQKKTPEQLIEDLALMVGRGFAETKSDMKALRQEMNERFAVVEERLDRIEYLVTGQERRITILEDHIRQVATKIGLTFN